MYHEVKGNLKFMCPFAGVISGPSMSGKTHFLMELMSRANDMFEPAPDRIVYAYGIWQEAFTNFPNVEFVSGVDGLREIQFDSRIFNLLIIDDLMDELCNDKKLSTLFTRDVHHKNITVLFVVQNVFKQGKSMRDVQLGSQVLVLFKQPRDIQQIQLLGSRMGIKNFVQAYNLAIKERYGYLLVNLQPHTPDELRLQTDIFKRHRRIFWK